MRRNQKEDEGWCWVESKENATMGIEEQRATIKQFHVLFLGSDVQTELLNYRMSPKTPRSSGIFV